MRLDKFLKNSRLIKRRTIAKEASDKGRIEVNGKIAKAGTQLKLGDEILIRLGEKKIEVRVVNLLEHVNKDSASEMYEYIE